MSIGEQVRAVVTGAGSGLGQAFCRVLAARGASVVVSDIDLDAARATAASLPSGRAYAVGCDVAQRSQVLSLADEAERLLGGPVDLVVNNAGVAVSGLVGEIPPADWQWIMGINLWGVIYGCEIFVPRLRALGRGHVINVASAAGLLSAPTMGPYNVTKAGVVALSETMRGELRGSGVGVTVLCPTFFPTNIGRAARRHDDGPPDLIEKLMARSKFSAEDVARVALEAAEHDRLFALPQADARWFWRAKRLMPTQFHDVAPKVLAAVRRRAAARR